jgi:hypothetical protein
MNTLKHSTHFDQQFLEIPFYQQYPEMLPMVGSHYKTMVKKVVFIGESHYLPNRSKIHLSPDTWYNGSSADLDQIEKEWINTRGFSYIGNYQKNYPGPLTIYRNIEKAILESGFSPPLSDNLFRYTGFFNYFLRPAKEGVSLERENSDKEKAYENFKSLQQMIGFEYVVFTSRLAYFDFKWYYDRDDTFANLHFIGVPHPSSTWWNRKSAQYQDEEGNQLTGKESVLFFIKKHGLFRIPLDILPQIIMISQIKQIS